MVHRLILRAELRRPQLELRRSSSARVPISCCFQLPLFNQQALFRSAAQLLSTQAPKPRRTADTQPLSRSAVHSYRYSAHQLLGRMNSEAAQASRHLNTFAPKLLRLLDAQNLNKRGGPSGRSFSLEVERTHGGHTPISEKHLHGRTKIKKKYVEANLSTSPSFRESGMPDFIHHWNPQWFKRTGYGLIVATAASFPLYFNIHEVGLLFPMCMSGFTAVYWAVGLKDLSAKTHALRQNFPVLIYFRYFLESLRPEIRQYLIESDSDAVPFSRSMRNVVYNRAKGLPDTTALGTREDVYKEGYEWINHSMFPIPVEEVEDRVVIGGKDCKQPYSASLLNISAMSYGALSGNAIEALSRGAKMGNFYHNTGEGGISRFHKQGGADLTWNIGTGYFACGSTVNGKRVFNPDMFAENAKQDFVKMIEIKLSQGAKPAHGGILPAAKITAEIAEARGLGEPPYEDCVSPPRHAAFDSPRGLLLFVEELRRLSNGKPIGFKMCVGRPEEFAALCHGMLDTGIVPDFITIDGSEGGTGAAPPEFQDHAGMPLQEGLRLVDSMLIGAGLRDKMKLIASGKVYNGFSLVRTLALGADVCNSARSMMFALGCIQALRCNKNDCPTGITTQRPDLSSSLDVESKANRVFNFQFATVHAACEIIGAAGLRSPKDVKADLIFVRTEGRYVRDMGDADDMTSYFNVLRPGILLNNDGDALQLRSPRMQLWWDEGGKLYKASRGH